MNYLVKNAQGEILKLTVVSGVPQLPEGMELVGEESIINPLGLDHAVASLQIVELEPARSELVSAEVLAVPEVLYQAEVLAQAEILAVPAQAEKWIKDGQADVFVDPLDVTWTHVPAVAEVVGVPAVAYQAEIAAQPAIPYQAAVYNNIPAVMGPRMVEDVVKSVTKTKTEAITAAFKAMEAEVLAQVSVVFGTTNESSANANLQTWEKMKANPILFVPSKFGTQAEVVAYAEAKLAAVDAYAVFREAKIDAFRTLRAAILAG